MPSQSLRLPYGDSTYYYRTVAKVDQTMAQVQEQREVAEEIAGLISDPGYSTAVDDVSLSSCCFDLLYTLCTGGAAARIE